uniref:Uncharacterized protein n=1 Tax=Oryza sativa subsp. japonica TaxID=39947 RepID=Q6H804_ORYSJ|nr:hypothetical protein [Oryza sativa Japonica Group]
MAIAMAATVQTQEKGIEHAQRSHHRSCAKPQGLFGGHCCGCSCSRCNGTYVVQIAMMQRQRCIAAAATGCRTQPYLLKILLQYTTAAALSHVKLQASQQVRVCGWAHKKNEARVWGPVAVRDNGFGGLVRGWGRS